MAIEHGEYAGYMVYEGAAGEKPKQGAFYRPKSGDNLSHLAYAAYGPGMNTMWRIINANPWNRANCIYIAGSDFASSANCSKKRLPPSDLTSPGFLSLCPEISLGKKFQIIWIPPMTNPIAMPEKIPTGPTFNLYLPAKLKTSSLHVVTAEELANKRAQAAAVADAERRVNTKYTAGGSGANATTDGGESSSYIPWIVGGVFIVVAGGMLYATTRSGKRGRR
jgi:hypothetical protein